MLSKTALNAAIVALSALIVSAAPTQIQKRDVSVVNGCVNQNQVALTWDGEHSVFSSPPSHLCFTMTDGPYIYEQDIAGHLADAGSKGTFFFNGNSERTL